MRQFCEQCGVTNDLHDGEGTTARTPKMQADRLQRMQRMQQMMFGGVR